MGDGSNLPFQEYAATVRDKVSLKLATDEGVRSVSWLVSDKNERIVCRRAERRKIHGDNRIGVSYQTLNSVQSEKDVS